MGKNISTNIAQIKNNISQLKIKPIPFLESKSLSRKTRKKPMNAARPTTKPGSTASIVASQSKQKLFSREKKHFARQLDKNMYYTKLNIRRMW
jgi:hypothetical protein